MQNNVLVVVFNVESEGYQAITEIKNNCSGPSWFISEAALVKKENDSIKTIDIFDSAVNTSDDTLFGGLIGMCVGVLGGPIGMLLGASYGSLVGLSLDAVDASDAVSILEQIAGKLDNDMVALVAKVTEESPEGLDAQLSKYDAVIARFDTEVVVEEVARAREMEYEMQRLALIELREQKKADAKLAVEERREKIKADFAAIKAKHEAIKTDKIDSLKNAALDSLDNEHLDARI